MKKLIDLLTENEDYNYHGNKGLRNEFQKMLNDDKFLNHHIRAFTIQSDIEEPSKNMSMGELIDILVDAWQMYKRVRK